MLGKKGRRAASLFYDTIAKLPAAATNFRWCNWNFSGGFSIVHFAVILKKRLHPSARIRAIIGKRGKKGQDDHPVRAETTPCHPSGGGELGQGRGSAPVPLPQRGGAKRRGGCLGPLPFNC